MAERMKPWFESERERLKKHIPFSKFIEEHLTRKYLEYKNYEQKDILRERGGLFAKNPDLFLKVREELARRVGIPLDTPDLPKEFRDVYIHRQHADALADFIVRKLVAAEGGWWKRPFYTAPEADVVKILVNTMLEEDRRLQKAGKKVLLGPYIG